MKGFSPIYHVNKSIRQTTLIQLIKQAFEQYYGYIEENLPQNLVDKYRLFARNEAMVGRVHLSKNNGRSSSSQTQSDF